MKVIYAQEDISIEGKSVFLAGPTPRGKHVESWRPEAIKLFRTFKFDGTLLIPEMKGGFADNFEYSDQIEWEEEGMNKSDLVMFWIPRKIGTMPAFTTNIEFGYWLAKDILKIMLGIPPTAEKMRYIKYYAGKVNIKYEKSLIRLVSSTIKRL